jgi:8-oxo-dGTP pyrophosphatase MutT (NUDIX family)
VIVMELQQWRDKLSAHRPTLQGARGEYAVLVPLVERSDGWHLLYEVRAAKLRHQPGEVCFPGGQMEPGETPVDCALRETREELGVDAGQIEVLGQLDFVLRGQSIVFPVLAHLRVDGLSALTVGPDEVAEVFTVPLQWLQEHPPELYRRTVPIRPADFPYDAVGVSSDYPWAPLGIEVPIYHGLSHPLWGLTARITAHLTEQLQ